jgi:NADPH:quinone reductase-like Zn-dependent oxidoreductase
LYFVSIHLHHAAPGTLAGIDFAGEVVRVGNNMDPKCAFSVGDRVAGGVHGGAASNIVDSLILSITFAGILPDTGAFAEYVKADAAILWTIPEDTLTMEEATTFGVGFMAAVQAMFHSDRLAMVKYPDQAEEGTWVCYLLF